MISPRRRATRRKNTRDRRFFKPSQELLETRHLLTAVALQVDDWLRVEGVPKAGEDHLLLEDATATLLGLPGEFAAPRLELGSLAAYDDDQNGAIDGFDLSGTYPIADVSLGTEGTELIRLISPAVQFDSFVYRSAAAGHPIRSGAITLTASSATAFPLEMEPILGDLDADGDVDAADRSTLRENWTGALPSGTGLKSREDGDLDNDQDVDSIDYTLLISHWTPNEDSPHYPVGTIDITTGTLRIDAPVAESRPTELLLGGVVPFEPSALTAEHRPRDAESSFVATGFPSVQERVQQWRDALRSPNLSVALGVFDDRSDRYVFRNDEPLSIGIAMSDGRLLPANTAPVRLQMQNLDMALGDGAGSVTFTGTLTAGGFDGNGMPQPLAERAGGSSSNHQVRLQMTPVSSSLGEVGGTLDAGSNWTIRDGAMEMSLYGMTELSVSDGSLPAEKVLLAYRWALRAAEEGADSRQPQPLEATAIINTNSAGASETLASVGQGFQLLRQILTDLPATVNAESMPLPLLTREIDVLAVLETATAPVATTYFADFDQSRIVSLFGDRHEFVCRAGGDGCLEGDLLRGRLRLAGTELPPRVFEYDLDVTKIGAITELGLGGELTAIVRPTGHVEFGVDDRGFFVTADSELGAEINGVGHGTGAYGPFSAELRGEFEVNPRLSFGHADTSGDGKVHLAELSGGNWTSESILIDGLAAGVTADLHVPLLDYVDVDHHVSNNSSHGGDSFVFSATSVISSVHRSESEFEVTWSDLATSNPDVNRDGVEDFSSEVLAENAQRLVEDVVSGARLSWLRNLTESLNRIPFPGTSSTLSSVLRLDSAFAEVRVDSVEIVERLRADSLERWLNHGLPATPQEILRLRASIDVPEVPTAANLQFDLADVFPDLADENSIGIENARFTGQLIFGIDTDANAPLYAQGASYSQLEGTFELVVDLSSQTFGGGIYEFNSAQARLSPRIRFGLPQSTKYRIPDSFDGSSMFGVSLSDHTTFRITADSAELFSSEAESPFTGSARIIAGEVDARTGAFRTEAVRASLAVGEAVEITANFVEFALDPSAAAGAATVARLEGASVTFPSLPSLPTAFVDEVTVLFDGPSSTFSLEVSDINIRPTAREAEIAAVFSQLPKSKIVAAASAPYPQEFDWEMEKRTQVVDPMEGQEFQRIVVPNNRAYADPDEFGVTIRVPRASFDSYELIAHVIPAGSNEVLKRAEVAVDGPPVPTDSASDEITIPFLLPEGDYRVRIFFREPGTALNEAPTFEQPIRVDDILVVAIGDSYSSGEGVPDVPRRKDQEGNVLPPQWLSVGEQARPGGKYPPRGFDEGSDIPEPLKKLEADQSRQHQLGHRSSFAASAQYALALEESDPHTSVTFVFVSASGATIKEGALGPYAGRKDELDFDYYAQQNNGESAYDKDDPMPPQIDQVAHIVGDRQIDVMTVSFGGNDVGFAQVATALLLADKFEVSLSALSTLLADDVDVKASLLDNLPSVFNLGLGPPGMDEGDDVFSSVLSRFEDRFQQAFPLAGLDRRAARRNDLRGVLDQWKGKSPEELVVALRNNYGDILEKLQIAVKTGTKKDWRNVERALLPLSLLAPLLKQIPTVGAYLPLVLKVIDAVRPPVVFTDDVVGLDGLEVAYEDLNDAINSQLSQRPRNILITEYPDVTRHPAGETCPSILGDIIPLREPFSFFKVDKAELEWVQTNMLAPLNEEVKKAAAKLGWTVVTGISDAYNGHAQCGEKPDDSGRLTNPLDVRFVLTENDSVEVQGPDSKAKSVGTLHPNRFGNEKTKERLIETTDPSILGQRRPIVIIPDIGASLPAQDAVGQWLVNLGYEFADSEDGSYQRGVPPGQLQIVEPADPSDNAPFPPVVETSPLSASYADLINTLQDAGYVLDRPDLEAELTPNLFVSNYDWRLRLAPHDDRADGRLSRLTTGQTESGDEVSITDQKFEYAVDYLGHTLTRVAEAWWGSPVDIIAVGAGGLIARAYMQSDAYRRSFQGDNRVARPLPGVGDLIMVGVPNEGQVDAWSVLQDNWDTNSLTTRLVKPIANVAYQKLQIESRKARNDSSFAITTPYGEISSSEILDTRQFIQRYLPVLQDLVPTFDFIDDPFNGDFSFESTSGVAFEDTFGWSMSDGTGVELESFGAITTRFDIPAQVPEEAWSLPGDAVGEEIEDVEGDWIETPLFASLSAGAHSADLDDYMLELSPSETAQYFDGVTVIPREGTLRLDVFVRAPAPTAELVVSLLDHNGPSGALYPLTLAHLPRNLLPGQADQGTPILLREGSSENELGYARYGKETFHFEIPDRFRGQPLDLHITHTAAPSPEADEKTFIYIDNLDFGSKHLLFGNPDGSTYPGDAIYPDSAQFLAANPQFRTHFLIERPQYALSYNDKTKTPNWVAWQLNSDWLSDANKKLKTFRRDTSLLRNNYFSDIVPADSTYEPLDLPFDLTDPFAPDLEFHRGHISPDKDRSRTKKDQRSTMFMSNMIPQEAGNNSVTWLGLENYSRELANDGKDLYILAGAYGNAGTTQVPGSDIAVTVPTNLWKVILVLEEHGQGIEDVTPRTTVIAVDMPNKNVSAQPWFTFVTTVDAIEEHVTDYFQTFEIPYGSFDIFSELDPRLQRKLESKPFDTMPLRQAVFGEPIDVLPAGLADPQVFADVFASAAGLWEERLGHSLVGDLTFAVEDLPTGQLGEARITELDDEGRPFGGTVVIDVDAAGAGWFADETPDDHLEFDSIAAGVTSLPALSHSLAQGRYDLYTVFLHELGHIAGFISGYRGFDRHVQTIGGSRLFVGPDFTAELSPDESHLRDSSYPTDLMSSRLQPSQRRLPSDLDVMVIRAASSTQTAESGSRGFRSPFADETWYVGGRGLNGPAFAPAPDAFFGSVNPLLRDLNALTRGTAATALISRADSVLNLIGLINGPNDRTTIRVKAGQGQRNGVNVFTLVDTEVRPSRFGDDWYVEGAVENAGDGTVAYAYWDPSDARNRRRQFSFHLDRSVPQFRVHEFTEGKSTEQSARHEYLLSNRDLQDVILKQLGVHSSNIISRAPTASLSSGDLQQTTGLTHVGQQAAVVDREGHSLGYSQESGVVTEIEDSYFFGNVDGFGYIVSRPQNPLTYELVNPVADPSQYYLQASPLGRGARGGAALPGLTDDDFDVNVPLMAPAHSDLFPTDVTTTGNFRIDELFGQFDLSQLVEISDPAVEADLSLTIGPSAIGFAGDLTFTAEHLAVFPNITTPEIDGLVEATGVFARLVVDSESPNFGKLVLTAESAEIDLGDILTLSASGDALEPAIEIVLDPESNEIATIRSLSLDIPSIDTWPTELTSIDELVVRRDGFAFAKTFGADQTIPAVGLGQSPRMVEIIQPELAVDVDVTVPSSIFRVPEIRGTVSFTAGSATLLPESSFTASVLDDDPLEGNPGLSGSLDLASGEFQLQFQQLQAEFADLFLVEANPLGDQPGASLHFDPTARPEDVLLALPSVRATIPEFTADGQSPTATIAGLAVRYGGGIEIGSMAIELPDGYTKQLGAGSIVPLELTGLAVHFDELPDGTVDLDSLQLTATATVDTLGLEQQLGGLLPQPPSISVQRYDTDGSLTDLSDGGEVSFGIRFDDGAVAFSDVPGFQIGLDDLALGLPAGQSVILAGSLTLPSIDGNGTIRSLPTSLVPTELSALPTPPQAVLDISAAANGPGGTLGGQVRVAGSFNPQSGPSTQLSLAGQAQLAGDLTRLGGAASGVLQVDFTWNLLATTEPDGRLSLRGLPLIEGIGLENLLFEVDNIARLTVPAAQISFTAASGEAIATAVDPTLEILVPGLEGIMGTIGLVQLFDDVGDDGLIDGFSITDAMLGDPSLRALGAGGLSVVELTDSALHVADVTYRGGQLAGSPLTLSATEAALLPNGPVSLAAQGVSGDTRPAITAQFDPAAFDISVDLLAFEGALTVGGERMFRLFGAPGEDNLPALSFILAHDLGPNDPAFSLPRLSGSLDALGVDNGGTTVAPSVTLEGFTVQQDGDIELDQISVSLPDNYLNKSLGLGGLLPAELRSLEVDFAERADGSVDLSSLSITATAAVDTAGLEMELGELLGGAPSIEVGRYDSSGMVTDLANGGEVSFGMSISADGIDLIDVPGFVVGISDLEIGLPAGQTISLAGSLILPAIDSDGVPRPIPVNLVPAPLAATEPPPLAALDIAAVADTSAGVLGGQIVVGGSLTGRPGRATQLILNGQASVNGDLSFLGGEASGAVTGDFAWNLSAESQADGTLALGGTPRIDGLLFEQVILEVAGLARLTVDAAEIDFDAPVGQAAATAANSRFEFLIDGLAGVGGSIGLVRLFDDEGNDGVIDGFSIENVALDNQGTLAIGPALSGEGASLLQLTGASLTIPDLTYRNGVLASNLPDITFAASEVTLTLPGVNVDAPGLSLSLNPNRRAFQASASSLSLGVGETFAQGSSLFDLEMVEPTLTIDEDDDTDLLRVTTADLTFGPDAAPLDALRFDVAPTVGNQDQALRLNVVSDGQGGVAPRFGLGQFSLETTTGDGVLASLGLSGLLPVDIRGVSLSFPETDQDGYTNFSHFDVIVTGEFDFDVFGDLPFTPTVSVGQTPLADGSSEVGINADGGTGQFQVPIAFDFSGQAAVPIVPVFQDVVLGLGGLELGGFTFAGEVSLAGYRLSENKLPVALAYGVDGAGQIVLVDALSDADPNEPGLQLGAQIAGRLGVMADEETGSGGVGLVDFDFNRLEVLLSGATVPGSESTTIQLTGELDVDGTVGLGEFLVLDSFGLSGSLDWTLDNDLGGGELALAISRARTRGITVGLGEFFEASASGSENGPDGLAGTSDDGKLAVNFSNDPDVPLVQAIDVTLGSPAIGLYGSIQDLVIMPGAVPDFGRIDGIAISIEEGSMLDTLQDWFLPIRTNQITVDFEDGFFEAPVGVDENGGPLGVTLLIDGSVGVPGFVGDALGDAGLDAEVAFSELGVDVGKLRDLSAELLESAGALGNRTFDAFIQESDRLAIANAFSAGLQHLQDNGLPFSIFELGEAIDISRLNALGLELGLELGDGIAARGAVSVGKADADQRSNDPVDDVYFLAIDGALKVASYGGGGTLVLTTAGPVAATIEFGVPIPIGPTTLTLGGGGGIVFGKDLLEGVDTSQPTINPADIPTPLDWELTDLPTVEEILAGLWDDSTHSLTPVWDRPATLAINGKLSSLAVLGLVSLEGTLAASLPSLQDAVAGEGLSFLGVGDVKAVGMPFATGGVLVDARDLLNPTISFGFRVPPPDNPLSFLFPVRADLAGTLRTDGMIEAWLVGLQTLVQGAVDDAQGPLAELLDGVARALERDRLASIDNGLATALSLDPNVEITGSSLSVSLLATFAALADSDSPTHVDLSGGDPWATAASVASQLWTQWQLASNRMQGFDFTSAIGEVFAGLLQGAASSTDQAIISAYDAFNPSLVLRGAIQPSILGFPIGQPTDEANLVIHKHRMTLDLNTTNVLASAFAPLRTLGISDRLEVGFTADLPGTVIDAMMDPSTTLEDMAAALGDALNPFTGWEAKLAGTVSLLGFELGKVSGIAFGPQETDASGQAVGGTFFAENVYNFAYTDDFELTGENTDLPPGFEDSIPVYFDRRYRDMTEYGGLLLTGELTVPEMLRNPVPTFDTLVSLTQQTGADLVRPWADLTGENLDLADLSHARDVAAGLQAYFEQVIAVLTNQTPLGTLQIYVPSPATLVDSFLDYTLPAVVGSGDGSGEMILADRVPGEADDGSPEFAPAAPYDGSRAPPPLRFADLNGNAFYDPRVDVLITPDGRAWSDAIPSASSLGDLVFQGGEDAIVPEIRVSGVRQYILNDIADDEGNGRLDPASTAEFAIGTSAGFVDSNHNGTLDWSADPRSGVVTFHEAIVDFYDGADLGAVSEIPSLSVFLDESASSPGGQADGYTTARDSAPGDRLIGLNEGFFDTNDNSRFDLETDILYDLNGNGLPDGELFIDLDGDGRYTRPEPLDDINGNGLRDISDSLSEPFTDLNGNGVYDTGEPFIDLGNGLFDPPAKPVFTFDDASAAARELFDAAYVDGFADVRLLGLDLGNGRIRADSSGLSVDISTGPYGADLTVGLGFSEMNAGEMIAALSDGPYSTGRGQLGLLETLLPPSLRRQAGPFREGVVDLARDFSFAFPVGSLEAAFDLGVIRDWLNQSFGRNVSDFFEFTASDDQPAAVDATVQVEFFSPLFNQQPPAHPTADPDDARFVDPPLRAMDDIRRYGGGRVSTTLNLPGFVEGAVGVFEAALPSSPDDLLAPDFAFLAKADRFAIPGLTDNVVRGDQLSIRVLKDTRPGSALASANVNGSVHVLEGFGDGLSGTIDGRLTLDARAGWYGHLALETNGGSISFGPGNVLELDGDADIRLLVNSTGADRTIEFTQSNGGAVREMHSVEVAAHSGILWVDGQFKLGTSRVVGAFRIQAAPNGIVVVGEGTLSDTTTSLLLGQQLEQGIDVTFAARMEAATRTRLMTVGGRLVRREVPDGAYGVFQFQSETSLALAQATTEFSIGFNTSSSSKTIPADLGGLSAAAGFAPVAVPGDLTQLLTLGARTGRLFVNGLLTLDQPGPTIDASGFFAAEFTLDQGGELDLFADATLDLGMFGSVSSQGYLEIGGIAPNANAAGYFDVESNRFGVRDIAEFSGTVAIGFNTGRDVDVPAFIRSPSLLGRFTINSGNYLRFEFDDARLDLFNILSVGGTGSVGVSEASVLTLDRSLGVQVDLPEEVLEPFGGLLPERVNLSGNVPAGSTSNTGLVARPGQPVELSVDLTFDGIADVVLSRTESDSIDVHGYVDLGNQDRSAFGGLLRANGDFELRINRTSTSRNINRVFLPANTFLLDVDGNLLLDVIPAQSNDTVVGLDGRLEIRATAQRTDVSGSASMQADILGVPLVDTTVSADVVFENGSMAGARFAGTFQLSERGPQLTGTAVLLPSGCLDLPGLLPDACGSMEVQLLGLDQYGEGEGTVQLEVRLTEPVPDSSRVIVTLSESHPAILLTTPSLVIDSGETTGHVFVQIVDDFMVQNTQTATVEIVSSLLDRPAPLPDEALTGTTQFIMTILDNDELRAIKVEGDRDGIEPDGTQSPTLSARFKFKVVDQFGLPASLPAPITVEYDLFGAQTEATGGIDFVEPSGSITIPANTQSVNLHVGVLQDDLVEPDERITLEITGLSNTGLADVDADRLGTALIRDEDTATVSVEVLDDDVGEGGNPGSFQFTLSRPSTTPTIVTYDHSQSGRVVFGTPLATPGEDFVEMPGNVVFAPTVTSVVHVMTPITDKLNEDPELAFVSLQSVASGNERITIAPSGTLFAPRDFATVQIKERTLFRPLILAAFIPGSATPRGQNAPAMGSADAASQESDRDDGGRHATTAPSAADPYEPLVAELQKEAAGTPAADRYAEVDEAIVLLTE